MSDDGIKVRLLDNILTVMEGLTFGKRTAERIVGGEKKLQVLMESGKVGYSKPSPSQNGKWQCNAADVLRHCRKS